MGKPAGFRILGAASLFSAAVLFGGLVTADGAETPAVQMAQAADKPATYSENQATRGARLFKDVCADCHGDDLKGGLIGGPPLRGSAFEKKFFDGAPASVLFSFISNQMPPDAPGQYSANEYVDVIAYILKLHGFDAGAAMPSTTEALDHLIIQK